MPGKTFIHIVDDDAAVCRALTRLLRAFGFESRSYGTAEDFLQTGACEHEDLLLLDIRLPGMSGWELCKQLLTRRMRIPVVLMTGHQDQETTGAWHLSNVVDVLRKPFDAEKLREAIEAGLKIRHPGPAGEETQ